MTFSEELGYEPDVQDWIHTLPSGFEVWTAEHCDVNNWKLPQDYGIEGVLFEDQDGKLFNAREAEENLRKCMQMADVPFSDNPTRDGTNTTERIYHYGNVFADPKRGVKLGMDALYLDVDKGDLSGGNGRNGARLKLGIPGYMVYRTKFLTPEAKIRHSMASQPKNDNSEFEEVPTKYDVKAGIITLAGVTGEYETDKIEEECNTYGAHLVLTDLTWVKREVKKELMKDGRYKCKDDLLDLNDDFYRSFIKNHGDNDPWIQDIWNKYLDGECYVQYINLGNKQLKNYYKPLIRKQKLANAANLPLHTIWNFDIKKHKAGTSTIQAQRDTAFTKEMHVYEEEHLDVWVKRHPNIDSKLLFPWNHPDAQNVALAQDRVAEKDVAVVRLKNRHYN
tara:strand:+ start:224 stop:1399 length:1176 start_codon:yes stop_codon:yes gene_type:complete